MLFALRGDKACTHFFSALLPGVLPCLLVLPFHKEGDEDAFRNKELYSNESTALLFLFNRTSFFLLSFRNKELYSNESTALLFLSNRTSFFLLYQAVLILSSSVDVDDCGRKICTSLSLSYDSLVETGACSFILLVLFTSGDLRKG